MVKYSTDFDILVGVLAAANSPDAALESSNVLSYVNVRREMGDEKKKAGTPTLDDGLVAGAENLPKEPKCNSKYNLLSRLFFM